MSISISNQLLQDFIGEFHPRRFLQQTPPFTITSPHPSGNKHNSSDPNYRGSSNTFDANIIMVLSVLLCALICSLGLNTIIRCAVRCSSFVSSSESGSARRIANTGVKRKALKTFTTVNYSAELKLLPGLDSECVICLSDFAPGDCVRLLPNCNHGFHVKCIDKWLSCHSSCPKCRHCLIETCQKIVRCSLTASSSETPPVQETVLSITPLGPEGLIHSYR